MPVMHITLLPGVEVEVTYETQPPLMPGDPEVTTVTSVVDRKTGKAPPHDPALIASAIALKLEME